jgi:hypothetical protein
MALEENGFTMPVQPMMGGYGNGGFGMGDWSSWIILFLIFGMFGGWGNGFGGGYGGGNDIYPWMNQSNQINGGFRDQMLSTQLNGIQNSVTGGFGDVQTALCGGFAGVNASINGAQNALAQQLYTNQISDLERSFAAQTASTQGMNALQGQLAQCCCDNRAATADLKYTVASENCQDRTQSLMNTRDIIDAQTRGTQAILDKLCALELDGVKGQLAQAQRENTGLQNQLNMAAMRESQTAQNALITQGFANEVDALYNRLNSCPVPTTPVYGRTPIFTCGGNSVGCGCGA